MASEQYEAGSISMAFVTVPNEETGRMLARYEWNYHASGVTKPQ